MQQVFRWSPRAASGEFLVHEDLLTREGADSEPPPLFRAGSSMNFNGFSQPELTRYARHLALPEVGLAGQKQLKEESNLQRQLLHGTKDIGRHKLDSAEERLEDVNPHVEVVKHNTTLSSYNALEIVSDYDVVIDGTDNFQTRYLVNDACVLSGKPNVYGSVFRWEGQISVFATEGGPCYRCLFREPPPPGLVPNCAEGGVLGVLPGIIGSIQALETIKLILGKGTLPAVC